MGLTVLLLSIAIVFLSLRKKASNEGTGFCGVVDAPKKMTGGAFSKPDITIPFLGKESNTPKGEKIFKQNWAFCQTKSTKA